MAYKKLIKVSNICQLLDKSKYPATKTINGVTFTNNGDGSIIISGTATDRAIYGLYDEWRLPSTLIGHKCLIESNVPSPEGDTVTIYSTNLDVSNNKPVKPIGEITTLSTICITVFKGDTANNIIVKPQLFDLTEMYGAGHEPTSVEQFRQDFPEEMYDYSPHCWLTSYKRVFMTGGGNYLNSYQRNLTCKTKNLFNAKAIKSTSIKVNIDGSVIILPQVTSLNGYTSTSTTLSKLCPNLKVGDTAILNFKTTSAYGQYIWLSGYQRSWPSGEKKIITEDMLNSTVVMYGANVANGETGQVIITNFQIELGDTATEYVPYGYL